MILFKSSPTIFFSFLYFVAIFFNVELFVAILFLKPLTLSIFFSNGLTWVKFLFYVRSTECRLSILIATVKSNFENLLRYFDKIFCRPKIVDSRRVGIRGRVFSKTGDQTVPEFRITSL